MEHNTTIISKKRLSDGAIAVLIQCCDASQQSWHTLYITADTTQEVITKWLDDQKTEVQAQHDRVLAAESFLNTV